MMRTAHVRVIPGTFSSCSMVAELMSTLFSEAGEFGADELVLCAGSGNPPLVSTKTRTAAAIDINRIRNLTSFILFFGEWFCKRPRSRIQKSELEARPGFLQQWTHGNTPARSLYRQEAA